MIITFYNEVIKPEIVEHQKMVFDHFNQPLRQIKPEVWLNHGGSIDFYLKNITEEWGYLILFDIDCIPLDRNIIPEAVEWVKNNIGLFSVAQRANHIRNSKDYASPAFLALSRRTYDLLNQPSFIPGAESDCAGELTLTCRKKGYKIQLMYPSHVQMPKWTLESGQWFGIGTNYQNRIYHAFESRNDSDANFVNMCKNVISKQNSH